MGWIRLDKASKRILHLSEPPFTIPPSSEEIDVEIVGSATEFGKTKLKGEPPECWAYDPATGIAEKKFTLSTRPAQPINSVIGYYLSPPVWISSEPAQPTEAQEEEEVLQFDLSVGIKVSVQRRGVFFFDFSGWTPGNILNNEKLDKIVLAQLKRTQVLNAHLVCLHCSLLERQGESFRKMNVDPHNLILKPDTDSPACAFSGTQIALLSWKGYRVFPRTMMVEKQTVLDSLEKLENIFHQKPTSLELVALLNLGASSFEDHNYPLAVIYGWTICERLLHVRWEEYLDKNRQRKQGDKEVSFISKKRKEKLSGHDYTASVITEILSLTNCLPVELYEKLEGVRKTRNDWLHNGNAPNREMAELAIKSAIEMIAEVLSLHFRLPLVRSLTY